MEDDNVIEFPADLDLEATEADRIAAEPVEEFPLAGARFITPDPVIVLDIDSQVLSLEAARDLAISLSEALREASSG